MATVEAAPVGTVQAIATCFSSNDFLKEWDFPIHPLHDFKLNGEPAHYAPGHPRQWGDATHWLDFRQAIRDGQPERSYDSYYAAVSPDNKLIAITSGNERVLIYDIETQELRQVLDGAGDLIFAPLAPSIDKKKPIPAYSIGCSASKKGSRIGHGNQLVFWELNQQGRLLDQEELVDVSVFAQQAIDAILPDLTIKHGWSRDFVTSSSLQSDIITALGNVATSHRRRHNTVFADAAFGGFASTSFSSDSKFFLYHTQNEPTQSSLRDPVNLPRVVVIDFITGKELHRLSGHTDAIMWSAISPDNEHIASVAWDGTLRMYSSESGELEWATTGGGQAWTGAFSADSKHIVWSTGNGQALFVHEVKSGKSLSSYAGTFHEWCRSLSWHPNGQQIALCAGKHAYVWRPFDGPQGTITQHYQIEGDNVRRSMASVETIEWLNNGHLLHLHFSDGTNLVYDIQNNTKELFMHPRGVEGAWVSDGFHENIKITSIHDGYISVDGDGILRYWSSGVTTGGS